MQHVEINISVALKGEQLSRADIARVYDTVCEIFLKAENKAELFGERFSGYALSPADKENKPKSKSDQHDLDMEIENRRTDPLDPMYTGDK